MWILYYIIINITIAIILFLGLRFCDFILRKYPKSKFSEFCRKNIISDVYDE